MSKSKGVIKRLLKIFNPNTKRNIKVDNGVTKKLTHLQINSMLIEMENNPKFSQLLIDNLKYLCNSVDMAIMAEENAVADRMFALVGQRKAYWYLLQLLTTDMTVEFKDEND